MPRNIWLEFSLVLACWETAYSNMGQFGSANQIFQWITARRDLPLPPVKIALDVAVKFIERGTLNCQF